MYKQSEVILGKYSLSILNVSSEKMTRFNELLSYAKSLRSLCIEGDTYYIGFTNLVGDIWSAFYKTSFQLSKPLKVSFHYEVIEKLLMSEEYKKWKKLTQLDELLSILTTEFFVQHMISYFKDRVQLNYYPARRKNTHRKPPQLNEASKQLIAHHIPTFLTFSKEEAISLKKSIYHVSKMDGKNLHQLSIKEQLQFARELQNNSTLKQVAELTGNLKRIVQKKQNNFEVTYSLNNITVGQEIQHMLPLELAHFYYPTTRLDFLKRFTEHQTLQYDLAKKEIKGMGPIVFCVDESSSMNSIKNECKAFCMALLMIAKKQKRDLVIIPFAHEVGEVQIFKKGYSPTDQIIRFCNSFLGGGTDYEKPLKLSLDMINQSEFSKADILFLTDGSSFLTSSFLEEFNLEKKKKKCECISIILTNLLNTVDRTIVEKFSDKIIEVNHLFEATEVFSIGKSS